MIKINPENPTSDDRVVFEFTGPDCALGEISKTVDGSQYIFKVDHIDAPCVATPPTYQFFWSVGRLKAGEYEVIHNDTSYEPATQVFSVSQGELAFPIPSLGIPAALLLTVGLAWIANKSLNRTRKRAA